MSIIAVTAFSAVAVVAHGNEKDGQGTLKRSIDLAEEVALMSNLNQIQTVIGMYRQDNEGKPPASYDELKRYAKFPAEMWLNPVDRKPLDYNPVTGGMVVTPYVGESPSIANTTDGPAPLKPLDCAQANLGWWHKRAIR